MKLKVQYGRLNSSPSCASIRFQPSVQSAFKSFAFFQGTCRNLNLYPVQMGKRLISHMIKNVSVSVIEECSVQCFMENACVSYNLGPQVDGKRWCELSDSDQKRHPNDLVQENGYGYRESKVRVCSRVSELYIVLYLRYTMQQSDFMKHLLTMF